MQADITVVYAPEAVTLRGVSPQGKRWLRDNLGDPDRPTVTTFSCALMDAESIISDIRAAGLVVQLGNAGGSDLLACEAAERAAPRRKQLEAMTGVALLGGMMSAIGVFLPWVQIGAFVVTSGIAHLDGAVILIASLCVCALAAWSLYAHRIVVYGWGFVLAGALIFFLGFLDLLVMIENAREISREIPRLLDVDASVGAGLYIVMFGGVVMAASGIASMLWERRQRRSDAERAETKQGDQSSLDPPVNGERRALPRC